MPAIVTILLSIFDKVKYLLNRRKESYQSTINSTTAIAHVATTSLLNPLQTDFTTYAENAFKSLLTRPAVANLIGLKRLTDFLVVDFVENPEERVWWRKTTKPTSFFHFLGYATRTKNKLYASWPWKKLSLCAYILPQMRTFVFEDTLDLLLKVKKAERVFKSAREFQFRIFVLYRRVMQKALGDYIKIFKHKFFMKYFRVFFEQTTGYKELELRYLWWHTFVGRGIRVGVSAVKSVNNFRLALLLRLDSFIKHLGVAPTPIAAKDFIKSGAFLINGFVMFNHFYAVFPKDTVQVLTTFFERNRVRLSEGWLGVWSKRLRAKLESLSFLAVEWICALFILVRWPRSWEEPRVDDGLLLSEQWLRFYIRFLMPTKIRKWKPAKYWWEVYTNNQRMWDRGYRVKFTGASRVFPRESQVIAEG